MLGPAAQAPERKNAIERFFHSCSAQEVQLVFVFITKKIARGDPAADVMPVRAVKR